MIIISEKLSQDVLDYSMYCWCLVSSTEKSLELQVNCISTHPALNIPCILIHNIFILVVKAA